MPWNIATICPTYYEELLEGRYDCVDRMVLNAYFGPGQTGGGLRSWWRLLRGNDADLDDSHLREMAGTLSRRLRAFCAKREIPIIDAAGGERKHELAEPYLPADPKFCGLFLVITGNAPAPVWEVKRNAEGRITDVRHRKQWPYVKHYRDRRGRLQLPLARGRVSFIRKVNDRGRIQVNGQAYFIGKRLARQYVTATVYPHRRALVVKHEGRVRKRFAFPVYERLVAPLSRPDKP